MSTKKTRAKKETVEQTAQSATASAPTNPAATDQPATTSLSINDLQAIATIVDVACQRGAFRAGEMTSVGAVYTKLQGFLDQVKAQTEEASREGAVAEEAAN